MRRFEAFKLDLRYNQRKLEFNILPHPPELYENMPGKFQIFLHGENKGFMFRTHNGWKSNRLNDDELTGRLAELICAYYKNKEEMQKKESFKF